MYVFYLKFIITNIIFSIIISSFIIRFNKDNKYSNSEILLYCFGLGPVFTTLLLYYLFLMIPNRTNIFYLAVLISFYLVIALFGKNSLKIIFFEVIYSAKSVIYSEKCRQYRIGNIIISSSICIAFLIYLSVYLSHILPQPLNGHDILNYGVTGKYLYAQKTLAPIWVNEHANSGYSYEILHPPSFSLILTWEKIINSFFQINSDFYFKSISTYYGFLIIGVQFYWAAKISKWLALISTCALISGLAFYNLFFLNHIDTYRILLYTLSVIFLAYSIKNGDFLAITMLGVFSGFMAFTHRLGLLLAVINCSAFFIFYDNNLFNKIKITSGLIILILLFGANHYIFDCIFGQGSWLQPR